ncbi:hypothetical protein L6R53_13785 [Myxococcota bacterium]|nr:hypothetical protein [Myxococcota bacterium]
MKLLSYQLRTARWFKVRKHVFHPAERWWDLFGSLQDWKHDWDLLRVAGFFNGDEGHRVCVRDDGARLVVDRNHDRWLHAAEQACEEALRAGRVFDQDQGRVQYIGARGVVVIVAPGARLVTCYRARVRLEHPDAAERGAVRRATHRASLAAKAGQGGAARGEKR